MTFTDKHDTSPQLLAELRRLPGRCRDCGFDPELQRHAENCDVLAAQRTEQGTVGLALVYAVCAVALLAIAATHPTGTLACWDAAVKVAREAVVGVVLFVAVASATVVARRIGASRR